MGLEAGGLDTRLSEFQSGIEMIEMAGMNSLKLVLKNGKITILPVTKDIDREQAGIAARILQNNSDAIMAIAGDQEKTRALLAETQKTLADVYWWWDRSMDLWHRMEKSYRKIFTDDQRCVVGETCIEDAVVSCTACGERRAREWEKGNSITATSDK